METSSQWWLLAIGFMGQGFFHALLLAVDRIRTGEEKRHSPELLVFQPAGQFFLLTYAILRRDIVFIVGQSTGSIIYIRNLYLIHREKRRFHTPG